MFGRPCHHVSFLPVLRRLFFIDFQHAARHAGSCRECVRLSGHVFLQQGLSVSELAQRLDVHTTAVRQWHSRFKHGGLEAMKD